MRTFTYIYIYMHTWYEPQIRQTHSWTGDSPAYPTSFWLVSPKWMDVHQQQWGFSHGTTPRKIRKPWSLSWRRQSKRHSKTSERNNWNLSTYSLHHLNIENTFIYWYFNVFSHFPDAKNIDIWYMFIKYVDKIDALTNIPQGQPAVTLRAGVLGIFRTEFGFHVFLRAARGGLEFSFT